MNKEQKIIYEEYNEKGSLYILNNYGQEVLREMKIIKKGGKQ